MRHETDSARTGRERLRGRATLRLVAGGLGCVLFLAALIGVFVGIIRVGWDG